MMKAFLSLLVSLLKRLAARYRPAPPAISTPLAPAKRSAPRSHTTLRHASEPALQKTQGVRMPTLTRDAAEHLRSVLGEGGTLWVAAEPVGPRGFRYVLEVRAPHELPTESRAPRTLSQGVPLAMDAKSGPFLAGAEIGFSEDEGGLHIDNPGAVSPLAFGGSARPLTRFTMRIVATAS